MFEQFLFAHGSLGDFIDMSPRLSHKGLDYKDRKAMLSESDDEYDAIMKAFSWGTRAHPDVPWHELNRLWKLKLTDIRIKKLRNG